jgi:hypothetical protein
MLFGNVLLIPEVKQGVSENLIKLHFQIGNSN